MEPVLRWTTTYTLPMPTNNDVQDASFHSTQLWFMVMSSVLFVSLIYSSAVQVILARPIITWLLGIDEADDPEAIKGPTGPPSEEILTITVTTLAFSGLFEVQRSTNVPRVSFVVSHGTLLSQVTRSPLDIHR